MNSNLEDLLAEDLQIEEKKLWQTQYIVVPLTILSSFMFTLVCSKFSTEVLSPNALASVIGYHLVTSLPQAVDEFERVALEQTPALLETGAKQALESIPLMSVVADGVIDSMVSAVPEFGTRSEQIVDAYFTQHGDKVKDAIAKHGVNGFLAPLVSDMLNEIRKDGGFGDWAKNAEMGQSIHSLRNVAGQLSYLADAHDLELTPVERKQRRVIAAWTNLLLQLSEDAKAEVPGEQ